MTSGKGQAKEMGYSKLGILIVVVLLMPALARSESPLLLSELPRPGGGVRLEFESEHRPVPIRRYQLISERACGNNIQAVVRHPDGKRSDARIEANQENRVSFKTPFGDGPQHGVHTLYVVNTQVVERRLVIRIAKWHTIHHSCGWGHAFKFDPQKIRVPAMETVPLEISCDGLWDRNLHAKLQSGDFLTCRVLQSGNPLPGAEIRLTSGRGWSKTVHTDDGGKAVFQLIRDYYTTDWNSFDRRHRERFTIVAEHAVRQSGLYDGREYDRIVYITSMPWTYSPSRTEYASYSAGLWVGVFSLAMGVGGIYFYRQRRSRPCRSVVFSEKD